MTDDYKKILSSLKKIDVMQILNLIPEHIYWKDKDGYYLGCNQSQARDMGLNSPEDVLGKTDYDLHPQKIAEECRKNDLMVMKNRVSSTIEEDDYISTKTPLFDEDNRVVGILGLSINFKDYKDRRDRTHRMLDEIIAAMPGHVYWKDRNGILQGCNEQQAIDVGLRSRHEIIGKSAYDILNKKLPENIKREHAAITDEADKAIMDSGVAKTFEESVIELDGKEVTYLSQKKPLHDDKGEVIGLLGISVNITELKKAKEQAEAANKAKTEFVQNMQHDIRTPSAGLWGVLDVLAKTEPNRDRKEALDMAVAASKRLLDLCNEAVEFGDLSRNTRPRVEKTLNIRDLARSVVELNKPAAFAKDLLLHFSVDSSVPIHIMSDEFRLSRILINLMGNAIKFTHKGEVTLNLKADVDAETRLGLLTIEIKDTGIGIAAEKIEHIYEKFSRAVASNTNLYPGTGLGLYVVKTFVDELNGDIELKSHENEGTYFKLSIPFKVLWEDMKKPGVEIDEHFKSTIQHKNETEQNVKLKHDKKPPANTPFTHELLIIEDDKTCLFAEKNLLSAFTSHIDTAENVAEALEKLSSKRYDLVISDLGLPDGSGNDIVAKVKATPESPNYKTPFVAMTAHQDAFKHQQAITAGFTTTNTKPLGSEKAIEFLNTYPAQGEMYSLTSSKTEGYPVIDLALGMQRIAVNSEEPAIEALGILWETLQEDIPLLKKAQENNDIEEANVLLLKIRGGLCYAGTPRLEAACEALYNEARSGIKDLRKIHGLFSVLYDEAKLFTEQFKEVYLVK